MTRQIKVDIFSDPVCPWCLVGLHRFDQAVAKLPKDVVVDIVHHPFLLDVYAPIEGEDVFEMLTRKYGRDPSEMWNNLERAANDSGLDLDMRKQRWRYPSQRAQVLIAAARDKGTQHALAQDIGHACYVEAQNISDLDVLGEIAARHGFEKEAAKGFAAREELQSAIERAAQSASAQGIKGVPFFVFANKYALSGAQPEDVLNQVMETVLAESLH